MQLRIPGRVWFDALDPDATGMQADLGLPQPRRQPKGMGVTFVYEDVTNEQAADVADYFFERSHLMSSQSSLDASDRELYRIMQRTAVAIRGNLGKGRPEEVPG